MSQITFISAEENPKFHERECKPSSMEFECDCKDGAHTCFSILDTVGRIMNNLHSQRQKGKEKIRSTYRERVKEESAKTIKYFKKQEARGKSAKETAKDILKN